MMFALFLCALSMQVLSKPTLLGWQFAGRGFDLAQGNLRPDNIQDVEKTLNLQSVWIPDTDNDVFGGPINSIEISFSTQSYTDTSSFLDGQSSKISVGATNLGGSHLSLQGSVGFNSFTKDVKNSSLVRMDSNITVLTANVGLAGGHVNPVFARRAATLPTSYNNSTKQAFLDFIESFGTHYIYEVFLGGRATFKTVINSSTANALSGSGVNLAAGISYNSQISANYTGTPQNDTLSNLLQTYQVTTQVFAIGGDPATVSTTYMNYAAWTSSLTNRPEPIESYKLFHYLDLIPPRSLVAMYEALLDYHIANILDFGSMSIPAALTMMNTTYYQFQLYAPPFPSNCSSNASAPCDPNQCTCSDPFYPVNPTPAPTSSNNANAGNSGATAGSVGAIVGGVVAGVFVLAAAIVIAVVILVRRNRNSGVARRLSNVEVRTSGQNFKNPFSASVAVAAPQVGAHVNALYNDGNYYPGVVAQVRGNESLVRWTQFVNSESWIHNDYVKQV